MHPTSLVPPRCVSASCSTDIDELIRKPYPNIHLHVGYNLDQLCLVLSPPGWQRMHLNLDGLQELPMRPPTIRMDTNVNHPNVFDSYICATILNKDEYYTPAYTLKGIAIQLLSFFGSDNIQQDYGGKAVNLESYRKGDQNSYQPPFSACERCGFEAKTLKRDDVIVRYRNQSGALVARERTVVEGVSSDNFWVPLGTVRDTEKMPVRKMAKPKQKDGPFAINKLPNELLLEILESLEDFEDLTNLSKVWPCISALIMEHNIIRQRELQCFVTKKTYREVKLGVGVSTTDGLASEFDLLSPQAFTLPTRKSVQNIPFTRWLPLPISPRHWHSVRTNAKASLTVLKGHVKLQNPTHAQILYAFMTDIVVKLNLVNPDNINGKGKKQQQQQDDPYFYYRSHDRNCSTLEHASEKAIESYFHLFHLLVCLATEDPKIVTQANALLTSFLAGRRDKSHCPNLGHLLVAMLVSDVPVTDKLRRAIITEAITRNVVWLLNPNPESRGRRYPNNRDSNITNKSYPELAYLEPDAVSAYRLDKTFQGSRTSYRLLMFSELFRRTARPSTTTTSASGSSESTTSSPSSLAQIRDGLFHRHGAPPPGAAAHLASEVRRLHAIKDFPAFLCEMGLSKGQIPTPAHFTTVLHNTVEASMQRGYSRWALASSCRVSASSLVVTGAAGAAGVMAAVAVAEAVSRGSLWLGLVAPPRTHLLLLQPRAVAARIVVPRGLIFVLLRAEVTAIPAEEAAAAAAGPREGLVEHPEADAVMAARGSLLLTPWSPMIPHSSFGILRYDL
ncbi:hypothetical protein PG994_004851 [Apiospora phragmitis]|uniref:F-box domain-containing protein n=1 Tax=Apiospora phragmitis TaxID=2905665 RepID=A0ABR1VRW3_9PEZI